jgi:hypothetical protein
MESKQKIQDLYNVGKLAEAYELFTETSSSGNPISPRFAATLRAEYRQFDILKTELKKINSLEYTDYNAYDQVPEIYRDLHIRYKKTIENAFTGFTVKSETTWPMLASIVFSVTGLVSLVPHAKIFPRVMERTENYLIAIFTFPGNLANGTSSKFYKCVCKMQIISDHRPLDAQNRPTTPYSGFLVTDYSFNRDYADEFVECDGTPITNFSILVTARKDICPSLISCCIQHRKTPTTNIVHSFVNSVMGMLIRRQMWFLVDVWLRKGILLYHVSKCTTKLRALIREQIDEAFVDKWFTNQHDCVH